MYLGYMLYWVLNTNEKIIENKKNIYFAYSITNPLLCDYTLSRQNKLTQSDILIKKIESVPVQKEISY